LGGRSICTNHFVNKGIEAPVAYRARSSYDGVGLGARLMECFAFLETFPFKFVSHIIPLQNNGTAINDQNNNKTNDKYNQ
jgi:hypothetical protein